MSESFQVTKIEKGTVIDHIPAGNAMDMLEAIETEPENGNIISVAMNVQSSKLGKKDVLKIEDRELDSEEVTAAAILAPDATLNLVEDYNIVEKKKLELPETIKGVVECPNPDCITNKNEPVETRVEVVSRAPVKVECHYCEAVFERGELDL